MTALTDSVLFQPLRIKGLELKNRIVMAPMTRSFSPGGIPGDEVVTYYRRRAEGGVGMIVSEGTAIDRPAAKNDPDVPDFHGSASLEGWCRVAAAVREAGGAMGPQLWHVGSVRHPTARWKPPGPTDSPSGYSSAGKRYGDAMSDHAISKTIAAFVQAATDAKRLGFNFVELHGAHGYLLDQFFWDATNHRTDRFGGPDIRERVRFAVEVINSVRQSVGPDFPIVLRLSQWKQQDFSARIASTPDQMAQWLVPLVEAGVDVLHCSQRRFWQAEYPDIDGDDGLNFAGWAKKLTGATTISVGSVGLTGEFVAAFGGESSQPASLDRLLRRMEKREFDLVAVGRALLADPLWVQKIRDGNHQALKSFNPTMLSQLA